MYYYLLVLLFVCPLIFHILTRYSRKGRCVNKLPGPFAYPFLGNILLFNVSCMNKFWEIGRVILKQYYPISRLWSCTSAIVCICHPDDLEILLSSQKTIDKGYMYEYLHPWLKTGLLTSGGNKWRHRRKILTPAFHFSILKKYIDITDEETQKLISSLKSEGNNLTKDLMSFCSDCTLNVICESAMGVSLDNMNQEIVNNYKKSIHDIGRVVTYRMLRPYITTWMMPFIYYWGKLQRDALKILHQFTIQIINDRKGYHRRTGNKFLKEIADDVHEQENYTDIGRKKRLAMLDLLLVAQQKGLIDDKGIEEEVDTFTFEGHDTTGMAMTFALLLLAENKEAQDLARNEVTEFLDKTNGKIEMTGLQELNYLERCIKESLRLYPPVSTLLRHTKEDLQLKHGLVPADTHIMYHLYDTHRDPNFWPDPNKFDPDRFLPENIKNRHPFAYVPFSAGPRNCIGQKFAIMELKILIGRLLYNFYLEPITKSADMKLIADIILRPLKPIKIKFIRIKKDLCK